MSHAALKMTTKDTLRVLLLVAALLPLAWSRTLNVTLHLSLNSQEAQALEAAGPAATSQPQLTQDMLHICMRETELSMSQLKRFHISLLPHTIDGSKAGDHAENELAMDESIHSGDDADYVNNPPFLDVQHNEPLQCFVRCLYERLDLIQYDVLLEDMFKAQLQRGNVDIKECQDLQSANRCEAAYKLHLCYNQLQTLEVEQRIGEVFERQAAEEKRKATAAAENVEDAIIVDGAEHSAENTIEGN